MAAALVGMAVQAVWAQDNASAADESDAQQIQPLQALTLIGSEENVISLAGSGFYLDQSELRQFSDISINRVLQRVPGVYVREEGGFGNFPNISIRGGDGTRSENITIMEDGIPTAPAPYASPSAYYSPNFSRMSGLEVLKGSSQVKYGPHTTGGVINYISTPFTEGREFMIRSSYGSFNTTTAHINYGDVAEGDFGRAGFLTEFYYKGSDGFRDIASAPGYAGSDNTGFDSYEPMVKLFWEPATETKQRIELKYGFTDFNANETYVGLTEADLNSSPYSRYAGTLYDNIASEQNRSYLKWMIQPDPDFTVENSIYYNNFSRNWYKIRSAGGQSIHRVLADPTTFANELGILRMQAPGSLGIRANARDYYAAGYQLNVTYTFETGEIEHELTTGVRYHYDQVRRFQRDDTINVFANGNAPTITSGIPGSGGNRLQEVHSIATYVQDSITINKLTLSPGIRYEYLDMSYVDYLSDNTNTVNRRGDGSTDIVAPGIGANYEFTEGVNVFGGVFKGISAPAPRSHIRSGVDWEESIGYESGIRYQSGSFFGELAGFYTDYDNITGSDAGLGGSNTSNAGEAQVKGIEIIAEYELYSSEDIRVPLFASTTYTDATLDNALSGGGGDDIFAGGFSGSHIPYVPEWKSTFGVGVESDEWAIHFNTTYTTDSYGTAANVESSTASARQGKIDGGWIADIAFSYQLRDNLRLFGGIQNVFDTVMTTSRIPEGPRVNAPQMFYLGAEFSLSDM